MCHIQGDKKDGASRDSLTLGNNHKKKPKNEQQNKANAEDQDRPHQNLKILQINVGRRAEAHDLAVKLDINLLLISEPNQNRVKSPAWLNDKNIDAAIRIRNIGLAIIG